jgi:choline-sulfatase
VFTENLAEGATTPLLMAKQGHTKYVFSAVDPEQLFDLEQDPHEQTNQIANPEYRDARQALSQLVRQQWDIETLTQQILNSQRRRLFLREALAKGKQAGWDFTPADELEQHCLRADKVYSQWAYQDILGYRVPQK